MLAGIHPLPHESPVIRVDRKLEPTDAIDVHCAPFILRSAQEPACGPSEVEFSTTGCAKMDSSRAQYVQPRPCASCFRSS